MFIIYKLKVYRHTLYDKKINNPWKLYYCAALQGAGKVLFLSIPSREKYDYRNTWALCVTRSGYGFVKIMVHFDFIGVGNRHSE